MRDFLCDLDAPDRVLECKELAPATYCGRMEHIELWTLDETVEGLGPKGTTLSERTIRVRGWAIPNRYK